MADMLTTPAAASTPPQHVAAPHARQQGVGGWVKWVWGGGREKGEGEGRGDGVRWLTTMKETQTSNRESTSSICQTHHPVPLSVVASYTLSSS
jgi:hypothetical protein